MLEEPGEENERDERVQGQGERADAGVAEHLDYAPPSFKAMAATLDAVRGDAGHLFFTIQHDNPFAAEARARLLAALQSIEEALAAPRSTESATLVSS